MERSALLLHYGIGITFCHYNLHTNIDKVSTDTIVIMSDSVKFCFNESTAQLGANQVIVALPSGLIIIYADISSVYPNTAPKLHHYKWKLTQVTL